MPTFRYIATDTRGKERRGTIDADSEKDAFAKLKEQQMYPSSISQAKGGAAKARRTRKAGGGGLGSIALGTPKIKSKNLTTMTRQMATLLDAGLPLVRALRTLQKQAKRDPAMGQILGELADGVEGGATFSDALSGHPKSFNKLYVNMIRAGEASGNMETVLNRLAQFMEKAQRLRGRIKGAMVYPVVVLMVALGITTALMVFVVPKFEQIFADMLPGEKLPGLTNTVIQISRFMKDSWYIGLAGLVALFFALKMVRKTDGGRYVVDTILIRVPPFNGLVIRTIVARLCRTLGTLMQSGVAVLHALQIVRDTAGNEVVARAIQQVHDSVKEGDTMSKPLEGANVFPGMMVSMIEVGEETGALPEMLNRVADVYEEEVDRAVEALTSLIEPIMIVVLAVLVGGIVIALFLPMIKLIEKFG